MPTQTPLSSTIRRVLACALLAASTAAAQAPREDVRSFVRAEHYHGLSADQALAYGAEAVPTLLAMLADEAESPAWPNVVHMLGLLGDERSVGPLIDFFETRFDGPVSSATYRALVQVPKSLGLLATDAEGRAHRYLVDGLSAQAWQGRALGWTYPTLAPGKKTVLLRKLSVGGLGLGGTPEAERALEGLRESLEQDEDPARPVLLPAVTEAILTNRVVQRHGRRALFEDRFRALLAAEREAY